LKPHWSHRIISAVILGALFGAYIHHDSVSWSQRGRDAFLASQAYRFDHYMAAPRALIVSMCVSALLILAAVAVYEALVLVLHRILGPSSSDEIAR